MKKRKIRHYILPHKKNGYVPWLLSHSGAAVLFVVIVTLFRISFLVPNFLVNNSNTAAVYSAALETMANQDRTQNNLPVLAVNPLLEKAAQAKANDMVANGYFAHYSPTGVSPWYWISQAGYDFSYAGENLAIDFSDSDQVNTAWLNSPEHRENIMNVHYTEIGVATAEGMYQSRETTFVVQMFGMPAPGANDSGANASGTNPSGTSANSQSENKTIEATATPLPEPKVTPVIQAAAVNTKASPQPVSATPSQALAPIAVKNVSAPTSSSTQVLGAEESSVPANSVSPINPVATITSNPDQTIIYFYIALSILILISLISVIIVGFKRQDHKVKHIVFGVLLLVLIFGFIGFTIVYMGSVRVV